MSNLYIVQTAGTLQELSWELNASPVEELMSNLYIV
jgi:hypothetical protein